MKRITVRVQPKSSQEKVELQADGSYKVWVHAAPHEGQANAAVITLLARYLQQPKSTLVLISGSKGRTKIIEINS